jgi:hypothetical protein
MPRIERDEQREERIHMEAVVDAYDAEEQAMGWYYYLEDKIRFPFQARCIRERTISPLRVDEVVEVQGMANEGDCMAEMFVMIAWSDRTFGVPLMQLEGVDVDTETEEAIADWHYWVGRGYQLCGW